MSRSGRSRRLKNEATAREKLLEAESAFLHDPKTSLALAREAHRLAQRLRDPLSEAEALLRQASCILRLGQPRSAVRLAQSARLAFAALGNPRGEGKALLVLGSRAVTDGEQ